jgi:periplasmic protein TonB
MTANADRGLAYATTLSLALHGLALALSAPALKAPPSASPAAIVARMVEQAAIPELPAPETIKPAAPKRQPPKRVAAIAPVATAEQVAPVESQPVPTEAATQVANAAPPQAVLDSMSVAQYRQQLIAAAVRYKRYPPAAVDNDWQGEVIVRLSVAASGTMAEVSLARSSGHGLLDEQVLAMFRNAAAEAPVPQALRGQEFAIEVRTVYSLKDQ